MSNSSLHIYTRPDNIMVYDIADTSVNTIQDWERVATENLESLTVPVRRLYDLRKLHGISMFAMRTGVKLKKHHNADLVSAAVVAKKSVVAELIKTLLLIQPGGNFKIFNNEDDAVSWLLQQPGN